MRDGNRFRTDRSRILRRDATDTEIKIWNKIRARQFGGYKFVRQEVIGPYTVDFVCRDRRIVVEVDGGQHAIDERDAMRDRWLREHGYTVLRFWNNDVLTNCEGVLQVILTTLEAVPPHPVSASGGNRPLTASGER
jgi:very-short-patch-repair endonuclease